MAKIAKCMLPVLNVGRRLGEDENGVLKYSNDKIKTFEALDIDLLSIPELESMVKSQGYPNYSAVYWLVPNAANLKFGLKEIKKESDINELRKSLLENDCVDFQIFFEHPISKPIIAEGNETANLDSDADSLSFSHDSYENAEDEAYKPPPDGYELSSDSDVGESKKVKKRGRIKKVTTPTKKASPKKNEKNTPTKKPSPTRRRSRRLGSDEKGDGDEFVDVVGRKGNETEAAETGKKKKGSRKYTENRKEKSKSNFGFTNSGSGPNVGLSSSGSQPNSEGTAGKGAKGSNGAARVVEPIVEEVDSEEDK
ncbi:hypothetical protein PIB30_072562 [Stylosanthes scabra]|uniref:PB1-like domain-containing protein n=1 Tax=Stylosanthes scabra TaxID=79078 RepID=A0ABU6YPX4_9FABA|nr:hypothetical protein [Stylosanthes scabra]